MQLVIRGEVLVVDSTFMAFAKTESAKLLTSNFTYHKVWGSLILARQFTNRLVLCALIGSMDLRWPTWASIIVITLSRDRKKPVKRSASIKLELHLTDTKHLWMAKADKSTGLTWRLRQKNLTEESKRVINSKEYSVTTILFNPFYDLADGLAWSFACHYQLWRFIQSSPNCFHFTFLPSCM
jgi:hypothetical protein